MKTQLIAVAVAVAVLTVVSGCSQKEESVAPPPVEETQKAANSALSDAATTAAKASDALKQTAETAQVEARKAAEALKEQSQSAVSAADERAQGLINSAKKLAADNKWTEVLNILRQLASYKLTPEQQEFVDGLKKQAQQQVAKSATERATGEAAKKLDGLLKK